MVVGVVRRFRYVGNSSYCYITRGHWHQGRLDRKLSTDGKPNGYRGANGAKGNIGKASALIINATN